MNPSQAKDAKKSGLGPFRSAVFRGLAILLPPLLTIVIFLWIGSTVDLYVLQPVNAGTRYLLVRLIADVREDKDFGTEGRPGQNPTIDGFVYHRLETGTYVPEHVYVTVASHSGESQVPKTSYDVYARYVELTYLRPYVSLPFFLCLFILALYLLGKFLAAGIGRMFYNLFERAIVWIPLVRTVYTSIKQVSDFVLAERELRSARGVVAIQWPCKGVWALAVVTGDGLLEVKSADEEPMMSLFVPSSPIPIYGFTVTVKKSDTVALKMTTDEAIQFIVSCGMVIPESSLEKMRVAGADDPQLAGSTNPSPPEK